MAKKNLWWVILIILIIILLLVFLGRKEGKEETQEEEQIQGQVCNEYPDFSGTPREGNSCIDTLDCTNHPPTNYVSGSISCIDGKCQFEC